MECKLMSALREPALIKEEPSECELSDRYRYFQRKNKIATGSVLCGFGWLCASMVCMWMGEGLGSAHLMVVSALLGPAAVLILSGRALSEDWEERANKPLAEMSGGGREEMSRLIKSVPEARRLSQQTRQKGRSLRMFDLDAMREFEKQRDAKRLRRNVDRLKATPMRAPNRGAEETN